MTLEVLSLLASHPAVTGEQPHAAVRRTVLYCLRGRELNQRAHSDTLCTGEATVVYCTVQEYGEQLRRASRRPDSERLTVWHCSSPASALTSALDDEFP